MISELKRRQLIALSGQGVELEVIADQLGIDVVEAGRCIANARGYGDRDVDDGQLAELRARAVELALVGENEAVSARMIQFLIERDKPRKDTNNTNVTIINQAIQAAQANFASLASKHFA